MKWKFYEDVVEISQLKMHSTLQEDAGMKLEADFSLCQRIRTDLSQVSQKRTDVKRLNERWGFNEGRKARL